MCEGSTSCTEQYDEDVYPFENEAGSVLHVGLGNCRVGLKDRKTERWIKHTEGYIRFILVHDTMDILETFFLALQKKPIDKSTLMFCLPILLVSVIRHQKKPFQFFMHVERPEFAAFWDLLEQGIPSFRSPKVPSN